MATRYHYIVWYDILRVPGNVVLSKGRGNVDTNIKIVNCTDLVEVENEFEKQQVVSGFESNIKVYITNFILTNTVEG